MLGSPNPVTSSSTPTGLRPNRPVRRGVLTSPKGESTLPACLGGDVRQCLYRRTGSVPRLAALRQGRGLDYDVVTQAAGAMSQLRI